MNAAAESLNCLTKMIYNGFQARLLHRDFSTIEETFAITPSSTLTVPSVTHTSSTAGSQNEGAARKAKYPGIYLSDYSPALQAKALKAVRRGAIYVQPCTSKKVEAKPTATDDKTESKKPEKEAEVPPKESQVAEEVKEGQEAVVEIENSTKLLLAFRAISPEHDNAEKASLLDDISQADLILIAGKGIVTSGEVPVAPVKTPALVKEVADIPAPAPVDIPAPVTPAAAPAGPIPALIPYALNQAIGSTKKYFKNKKQNRQSWKASAVVAASEAADIKVESTQLKRNFMIQLYLDNKLVPLAAATAKDDFQNTIQLETGALLDLGVVGKDQLDAPAKQILHTVTMHLWDSEREEVVKELEGKELSTFDLKKSVVPDVIFHFEIVSSGPPVLLATVEEEEAKKGEETKESSGVFVEQIEETNAEAVAAEASDDANIGLHTALISGERLGPLPSVAEEPAVTNLIAEDEKKGSVGVFKAKMQKTFQDAVDCAKKPMEPLLKKVNEEKDQEKFPEKTAEQTQEKKAEEAKPIFNTLAFKSLAKRISLSSRGFSKGAEEAPLTEEIKRKRRASMPDFTSLEKPFRRLSSNSKSRRSGSEEERNDTSAMNSTNSIQHADIAKTMKRADELKRELAKVELEKRKLELQWDQCMHENAEERVHLLEKRLEEGKREVREMRKRVSSRASVVVASTSV